jgi:HD-GYP domain-containing protein (c-di-GMP phosphodiesterase class II)
VTTEQLSRQEVREWGFASMLAIAGTYSFVLVLQNSQLTNFPVQEYLLAILFTAGIIFADQYPIHLLRGTKLSLINLPIFLATALLSAPLAMVVTGVGLLVANFIGREERGLLLRDIASTVGQWVLTVSWGYQIVNFGPSPVHPYVSKLELLLACAAMFLAFDFILFSLSQSLVYGEPFRATLKAVIKEGFLLEAIQYLIAILGILAADTDIWSLALLIVPIAITYVAFKNSKEMRYETVRILNDMADTVDLRDPLTGGHSKHVADLVHRTLTQLKISGPEATLIEISARLHDIGKIGIPDTILLKPGKLSPEEMAVMQTHAQKGAELISKYKDFSRGASMIMHHHERWDGQGYPARLKEHDIPFGARVIAVADSFEAMTSDRPYRKAMSVDLAIQILLEGRGKQWDPVIVNTFVDMVMRQMDEKSTEDFPGPQPAPQTILVSSQGTAGS